MMNNSAVPGFSKIAFAAMLFALLLLFTPFEESGARPTMLPKYLAAGASMCLLGPLFVFRPIRFTQPSVLVLVILFALTFHVTIVRPVPPQFALLIVTNLALAIGIYEARSTYKKEFQAAVVCLLVINVAALVIQMGLFYFVTHSIYDIHKLLFRSESRVIEDYFNIARFSGIHVEPGTYANFVSCLLAIYVFSTEFSKKVAMLSVAATFSVLMTHSASSMFFVSILLVLLGWLWRKKITLFHMLLVLGAAVSYVFASNFVDHLLTRFGDNDPSLSYKMLGINTYLESSLEEKFIGFGFGSDPCKDCHYQDIGFVLNLVSRGGIILLLPFSFMLFRAIRLHGLFLAALIFSFPTYCIMYFYEAPIWMFLLFAIDRKLMDKRVRSTAPKPASMVFQHAGIGAHNARNASPDATPTAIR